MIEFRFYEFDGFYRGWIENDQECLEILNYAKGRTDKTRFWASEDPPDRVLFYGIMDKE